MGFLLFPVLFEALHVVFGFPDGEGFALLELDGVVDDGGGALDSLFEAVLLEEALDFFLDLVLFFVFAFFHLGAALVDVGFVLEGGGGVLGLGFTEEIFVLY